MPPKTPKRSKDKANEAVEAVEEPSTPRTNLIENESNDPITPANMKVTELRDALTARGLSPKGLKKELVERLEEALKSSDPSKLSQSTSSQYKEADKAEEEKHYDKIEDKKEIESSEKEEEQVDYTHEEKATETNEVKEKIKLEPEKEAPKGQETDKKALIGTGTILHVTGFVRPFAVQSAKDLFTSHGPLKTFWMDSIKSFCFAEFETEDAASACCSAVDGLEFPAGFGKKLAARFADEAAMKEAQEKDEPSSKKRKASEAVPEDNDAKRPKAGGKSLDELFRKTVAKPHLYYLPAKP